MYDCIVFVIIAFIVGVVVAISAISFVWLVKNFRRVATYLHYAKMYYDMKQREKKKKKDEKE